jgi:hypothetical protein
MTLRPTIRSHLLVALVALSIPWFAGIAVASASNSGTAAIADCQAHERLTRHYTVAQLQNALNTMPADIREYTNCQQVIQAALTHPGGQGANNGTGSGSGGSFLPTPVIIVLVLLVLAAVVFGVVALRRRRGP